MSWNLNTNRRDKTTSETLICMCADCQKVRDEQGQWGRADIALDKAQLEVTHGFCPDCKKRFDEE